MKLNAGVITDVVGVDADGTAHKSVLAGSYTTTAKARTAVAVLSVKPNNVDVEAPAASGTPETVTIDVPADATANAARITGRTEKPVSGRPDLSEARIVVAGGRGVDGDFGPLEELADALGARAGASRAATDAGWIGHDCPGWPDGRDRVAAALHLGGHLRCDPAEGRDADLQGHRRDQ